MVPVDQRMNRIATIDRLCTAYSLNVADGAGGMIIPVGSDSLRLRNNGFAFPDLSLDELREVAVGLTRTLLHRGLNTIIDADHLLYWAWIAELLLIPAPPAEAVIQGEVGKVLGLCVKTALAQAHPPTTDRYAWELQNQIDDIVPGPLRILGDNSHHLLPYVAFPALEALTRMSCRTHVDLTGKVLSPFSLTLSSGRIKKYSSGSRCNSLRDLLVLQVDEAGPALKAAISRIRLHIAAVSDGCDGFDVLQEWRNSSLHGEIALHTIGGTVLNIACLMGLEILGPDFENRRAASIERAKRYRPGDRRFAFRSYYPPW